LKDKKTIRVQVRVEGVFLSVMVKEKFDIDVKEGTTLKGLFKALDRLNRLGKRFFRELPFMITIPTLLINGKKIEIVKNLKLKINDGDKIEILSPSGKGK